MENNLLGQMLGDFGLDNLDAESLSQIVEVVRALAPLADAVVPIADTLVDTVFKFTPSFRRIFDAASDYQCERAISNLRLLTGPGGFTREEAMAIILAETTKHESFFKEVLKNLKS